MIPQALPEISLPARLRAAVRQRLGYAEPPWGLDLLITDACNLRCSYCPMWGERAPVLRKPTLMGVEDAERVLDGVAGFRPMIRLFGGEPFVHPRWPSIVAAVRERGMTCTAVTNGMRLWSDAESLVRTGLYAVGVSLDTEGDAHDADRGTDTFGRLRDGLEALHEAKRRLASDTPRIEIFTTVHEGTYDRLIDWARRLSDWPIDTLRVQHLIWFSSNQLDASMTLLNSALPSPHLFRSEDRTFCRDELPRVDPAVTAGQLSALRRADLPFRVELHPDLPAEEMRRYYGEREFRRRGRPACTTMESYAFVDPAGRLYPCLTFDMGNVFERPFLEVWNGKRFRAFRRLVRRERRLPLCHRCPD